MTRSTTEFISVLGLTVSLLPGLAFAANSQLKTALNTGAEQLTSAQIADLIVDKTVTARAGKKTFLFHYGKDNIIAGKMIGGPWSGRGYYGITDDNQVCLSMGRDKGRLRCLKLLRVGGTVKKYNVTGKQTFELLEFQDGKKL